MAIRILIVDDQPMVRQGLRMYLALDSELEVVGEAGDGLEAVRLANILQPDVILMDLLMPHMDGIEATTQLRTDGNITKIVALSQSENPFLIASATQAGANIFISKDMKFEELVFTIKRVAAIG